MSDRFFSRDGGFEDFESELDEGDTLVAGAMDAAEVEEEDLTDDLKSEDDDLDDLDDVADEEDQDDDLDEDDLDDADDDDDDDATAAVTATDEEADDELDDSEDDDLDDELDDSEGDDLDDDLDDGTESHDLEDGADGSASIDDLLASDDLKLSFTSEEFADALGQANAAMEDGSDLISVQLGADTVVFVDTDDHLGADEAIILVGGSFANITMIEIG